MSQLYPDLSLTSFPGTIDSFPTWLDIVASDGPLIMQYKQALEAGNQSQANQILSQIPSATQKIIKATDLNKLTQAILALERFYNSDIQSYVQQQQQQWQNIINRFSYVGEWGAGTTYQQNNIVSYTASGKNLLYIAIQNPPLGTVPTNVTYWRQFTIEGLQGTSGVGLSYRGIWDSATTYNANDAATYNGGLWMSLQTSQNIAPGTNSAYWRLIMSLDATVYPIQPDQPTAQTVGGLWFNTSENPTQYYYLAPLGNPAVASDITAGKQAYDAQGNLITGTR